MDFPRDACPIVYSCLKKYEELVAQGKVAGVFGAAGIYFSLDRADWYLDLLESASTSYVSERQTLLRAFFAIELMYTDILQRQTIVASSAYADKIKDHFSGLKAARSPSGLEFLQREAEAYVNKAKAAVATAAIKLEPREHMEPPVHTLTMIAHSCSVLAGCMRRGDFKGITLIGEDLAHCMAGAFLEDSAIEDLLSATLSVGPDHPIHAWERAI
jgi:hypothetical protein